MSAVNFEKLFGTAKGPFERLLFALACDEKMKLRLDAVQSDIAVFSGPSGITVLIRAGEDTALFEAKLRELITFAKQRPLDLALIGGPKSAYETLQKIAATETANRVGTLHLDASNTIVHHTTDTALIGALESAAQGRLIEPDWPKLSKRIEEQRAKIDAQEKELSTFAETFSKSKPIVTYVLLAVIFAAFGLELLFGGFTGEVFVRMGALLGDRSFGGEWFRLVSCAFLHNGPIHLLMNSLALFGLGSSLEKVIGSSRFLILYTLSAIGGSVASALINPDGQSVGASGAIWGLLGAEVALAYLPRGAIPKVLAERIKKSALSNLLLNVLISFHPYIDKYAHFGGGATGALLMLSGLVVIGVREKHTPVWIHLLAAICGLILFGGFAIALNAGRPWELMR